MKVNYNWLQSYIAEPLPEPAALAEKIIFGAFEVENMDEIRAGSMILDVKTLPDRNHDGLSHRGIAREIAGLLGLTLVDVTAHYKIPTTVPTQLQVNVQTDLCTRYMARIIRGVQVGVSPQWITDYLQSIGVPSVNNIVDAYNIVMYDCGQPCCISDLAKIPSCLGGVPVGRGGIELPVNSVVYPYDQVITDTTTDIVLHIGTFDATAVRKQSRELNIPFDVTKRFENELTPELCSYAMTQLSALIAEMCPDAIFEEIVDVYPDPVTQRHVSFTTDYINTRLGTMISTDKIEKILDQYGYEYALDTETFTVAVPHERLDIVHDYDMVEEIGRVYGYNNIEPQLLLVRPITHDENYLKISAVKSDLISKGFYEVYTYTFTKKGDYEVARAATDKSALRTNLLTGLEESYEMNRLNKDFLEIDQLKIFEVGNVFTKSGELTHVAWMDGKQAIEMSIDEYVMQNNLTTSSSLTLPQGKGTKQFTPWSSFPSITRDVAVWVSSDVSADTVRDMILPLCGQYLIRGPRLFDTFSKPALSGVEGGGKTSYAFRMVFQASDKTLTEPDIAPIIENIYKALQNAGYEIR